MRIQSSQYEKARCCSRTTNRLGPITKLTFGHFASPVGRPCTFSPSCLEFCLRQKSYHADITSLSHQKKSRDCVSSHEQHLDVYLSVSRCLCRLSVLKCEGVYFQLSLLIVTLRLHMPGWIIVTL